MKLLVLNQSESELLLSMPDCIQVMTQALVALANGQVHLPLRTVVRPPEAAGVMALMPAHIAGENAALGVKIVNLYPAALYDYLASLTPEHDRAWDVGAGNGQAADLSAGWKIHHLVTCL